MERKFDQWKNNLEGEQHLRASNKVDHARKLLKDSLSENGSEGSSKPIEDEGGFTYSLQRDQFYAYDPILVGLFQKVWQDSSFLNGKVSLSPDRIACRIYQSIDLEAGELALQPEKVIYYSLNFNFGKLGEITMAIDPYNETRILLEVGPKYNPKIMFPANFVETSRLQQELDNNTEMRNELLWKAAWEATKPNVLEMGRKNSIETL